MAMAMIEGFLAGKIVTQNENKRVCVLVIQMDSVMCVCFVALFLRAEPVELDAGTVCVCCLV